MAATYDELISKHKKKIKEEYKYDIYYKLPDQVLVRIEPQEVLAEYEIGVVNAKGLQQEVR